MAVRRVYAALGLGLALAIFPALPLWGEGAAPAQEERKEIQVTADTLSVSEKGRVVEAQGGVEVRRAETVLKADQVRVDHATGEVEARGKVLLEDPEWKMKAEAVRLNLQQETGAIEKGEIFLERGQLSVSGSRFQKSPGQVYHIDEGFFTTCTCVSGPPTWKISAKEIELRLEGEAVIRHGVFYVMDVPVFYLPYGYFPLRTERQSGFLFPKIGSSNRDGFRYQQPFFWAISKSSDATLSVDVETKARLGLIGEYRQLLSRSTAGQIHASYFNEVWRKNAEGDVVDTTIADPGIPRERWSVLGSHRNSNPSGLLTYSDFAVFSDDLFTRELSRNFDLEAVEERDLRVGRYARSRLGFLQSWEDIHLQGEWAYVQDFIQDDERTFYQSPRLTLWGRRGVGKTPIELRWRTEGVNYQRQAGADGLRLDLRPELALPFRFHPYLSGSLDVASRRTFYHLYRTEGTSDRDISRGLVEVRGRLGTSVARLYDWQGQRLEKLKHVLEPEIGYLFIPHSDQRAIPIMDGTDRINRRNMLTFSLTQRLWARFASEPAAPPEDPEVELVTPAPVEDIREMGQLRMALSYDVDKERKGGDTLSDLDLDLRVLPKDYLSMRFGGGLNPGPWQVTQGTIALSLFDPRPIMRRVLDRDFMRPNRIELSYRFIRRNFLAELAENANLTALTDERLIRRNVLGELGVHALFHLTDHLLLLYDASYNTLDARFTGNRGGVKILSRCECWTLAFSANRTTNPDQISFRVDFQLLGLSSQNKNVFK